MSNQYPPPNPEQDPDDRSAQSGQPPSQPPPPPPPPPPAPPPSEPQWTQQSAGTPPPGSGGEPSYGQPGYGQEGAYGGQSPSYPPPPPGAPGDYGQPTSVSGLAMTSLALGVMGLLGLFFCGLGAVLGIGAIITGWLGLREIGAAQGRKTGKGMAIAGIVTGLLSIVLLILFVVVVMSGTDGPFYRGPSY